MRVISGFLKGRKIDGYNIEGTRATMDRVKESIFAIIFNDVKDCIFLDLFAGTGSIGIEAVSNGAKLCYFSDINKKAINVINKNINNFNISDKSFVINKDYNDALLYFKNKDIVFDIIYIDPPYRLDVYNDILDKLIKYKLISKNSLVILESDSKIQFNNNYTVIREKKYSNKYVSILKLTI